MLSLRYRAKILTLGGLFVQTLCEVFIISANFLSILRGKHYGW
ncbi:hypothetical protein SX4_2300 [Vibrio mimicus SX-4]|nr:hypothetical protein VII_003235 [Vibrio mimicus MB451]EGU17628.1 hypothetical protein SX4_2300 [Vibrio mimicus SX-4]